ncbi:unnamed protein product [Mucor hiemalis]
MDFNSSFNDDSWLYNSNNNNDFKFTFNTSLNELQPSTLIDPFLQEPFNFLTPATNTVLDENDQKAFSSFLDAFFMDPEMQFQQQNNQENTSEFYNNYEEPQKEREEEEEHRRSSILQSLDEQKMLHQRLNLLASLPANNNAKPSNDQSRSPSFNNTTSSVTSLSEDDNTTPQTIYLRQSDSITSPYTITPTTSSTHQITRKRSSSTAQLYSNYEKENKKIIKKSKSSKELLTEEEKRANHIASEQKRRSTIRTGFKDLTDLIPTLKNINNSKSTVLFKAVDFIRYLEKRNKGLREKVGSLELRAEVEGRMTQTTTNSIPEAVNNKHISDIDNEKESISLPFSAELPPLTPTASSTTSTSSSIATTSTFTASKFKQVNLEGGSNTKKTITTTTTSLPYLTSNRKATPPPHYTLSNGNHISKHTLPKRRRRSSSSSGSSSIYGNQTLQGLPANARNALLAHKTQQKQLLILQEQLQMHQRLIAQQQEMKERTLTSSSNMKNKLPPILGQYDTSSKSSRHNGKLSLLKELEDKAISAP